MVGTRCAPTGDWQAIDRSWHVTSDQKRALQLLSVKRAVLLNVNLTGIHRSDSEKQRALHANSPVGRTRAYQTFKVGQNQEKTRANKTYCQTRNIGVYCCHSTFSNASDNEDGPGFGQASICTLLKRVRNVRTCVGITTCWYGDARVCARAHRTSRTRARNLPKFLPYKINLNQKSRPLVSILKWR